MEKNAIESSGMPFASGEIWEIPLVVEPCEVKRHIGAGKKGEGNEKLNKQLGSYLASAKGFFEPRCSWREAKVRCNTEGQLRIETGTIFNSRGLVKKLEGAERVVLFAVSIGPKLEEAAAQLSARGKHFDAFLLEAIGSVAVESLAKTFQAHFDSLLQKQGESSTLRFGPGYGNWDVGEQSKLFDNLPESPAGIVLLDSCLMTPKKSLTGIFGIVPLGKGRKKAVQSPCTTCPAGKKCKMRH